MRHTRTTAALTAATLLPLASWAAAPAGCIQLTTTAQLEKSVKLGNGQTDTQLLEPGKVVPGDTIVWTTTARNLCEKAADNIVIDQPVPAEMNFIANSALGGTARITYSVDGQLFKAAAELSVRLPDGSTRVARAEEIRHVRWTMTSALAAKDQTVVRYRAVVR